MAACVQVCKHICSCCHRFDGGFLPTSVTKLRACLSCSKSASYSFCPSSPRPHLPSSLMFLNERGHCSSSKSLRRSREGQVLYKDEGQLKTHRDNVALKRLAYPSSTHTHETGSNAHADQSTSGMKKTKKS